MRLIVYVLMLLLIACVEDFEHHEIQPERITYSLQGKTELTFLELLNLHGNVIGKDTLVTGYVVSSDAEKNFYKELYVQNTYKSNDIANENPRMGLRIRIGATATHNLYGKGRKIAIYLEGLKKTKSNGVITLGSPQQLFLKDIVAFDVDKHIFKLDEIKEIRSKQTTISDLKSQDLNTMVSIQNLHFKESELALPLANLSTDNYDGRRILETCSLFRKDSIVLETSNFSSFSAQKIQGNQVEVNGLYVLNFDKQPVLNLNSHKDLVYGEQRNFCDLKTPNVLITEISDPKNASNARFLELYNNEDVAVNLKGWTLKLRKEDGVLKEVMLDSLKIPSKGFVIITRALKRALENPDFQEMFDELPSFQSSKFDASHIISYALYNEQNELIDVYGNLSSEKIDVDLDFTDSRVYRNNTILSPSIDFNAEEWTIVKGELQASEDFTPYKRTPEEQEIQKQTAPLLLTEIADPKEETKARFVEIYNPTNMEVSLTGWQLIRYNYTKTKNTKELAALPIILDGLTIVSKNFVVIARDSNVFQDYFDKVPSKSSLKLDGNGDDAYELIDPFGNLIDVFGNVNIDGSSTVWEYTDGTASRVKTVVFPNKLFEISEWEIVKKSKEGVFSFSPYSR